MNDLKIKYSNYQNKLSWKNKISRALWNITYYFLFRPFFGKYLNTWRIFLLRIYGAKIGKNCTVLQNVKIWAPWNLVMEDNTLFASRVICYNPAIIEVQTQTIISQYSYLCTASHDITNRSHPLITAPIIIKDQVWIAADAFIGPGVTIGQGAVVGARACVFKDVEPWTVVGGNPAKFIKKREIKN